MARRDDILSKIHPKMMPQVMAQLAAQNSPRAIAGALPVEVEASPSQRRVRQSRQTMNKLELAYQDMLRVEFPGKVVLPQSIRMRLGNGAWYKPDFFVPHLSLFIEVKGPKAFRGGFEYLKIAASEHGWAKFRLVWKENGKWFRQEILPSEVSR
jgi:hypothetical protein